MLRLLVAVLLWVPLAASARAQESAALFDAPLVTLGAYDRYGFLTDLDDDGFEDAVSWWWTNPERDRVRLRGWRNDGTGKLGVRWTKTVTLEPGSGVRILPCQLDADGDTDICIVAWSAVTASIRVLRSRGLTTPELATEYSVTHTGLSAVPEVRALVTDLTGDGLADLAYSVDGTLRLMEFVPGQPGLTLRSSTNPFGIASSAVEGLLEIDANGDATPDLLVWRDGTVKLIEVQACQPTATQTYSPGILDYKPATGDLDGDGDRDLVLWGTSTYVVVRRTGPATWALEPSATGGPSEFLFDVDLDGDLDGVCCGSGDPSTPKNTVLSIFRVSVNDGTGAFAPAIERPWMGSDHLAGIADLDHDGDLDVVSGRCILYARGPLTERPPVFVSPQTERTTADLDGDGDPDFTVGLHPMERNLGDGGTSSFTPGSQAAPPGTHFVGPGWPGDFDGDGDVDLVVKHFAGATFLGQRLLANLGGGAFADAGEAGPSGVNFNPVSQGGQTANSPDASLAADADGDGDVDLTTRTFVGNGYRSLVWWNDGAGYFTAGPGFLDEFIHWIGDLTGDGIPDTIASWLAYPGASYGDRGWHEGLGGGAFGPRVELAPMGGSSIAVADLDADGDTDLAMAFLFDLTLYWNDGGGVFTQEVVSSIDLSNDRLSHQVWSTDCNGDGLLDLLVTGSELEPACVMVLGRRTDNAGWETPFAQVIHTSPYTLDAALCDVDGDGDEDYVTNRLFRNETHSLPVSGRRRQVGAGSPGANGLVPTLGADGPFRIGESAELRITGGVGGATGVLTVTLVRGGERGPAGWIAPTFDPVLARIPFTLSGTPGVAGMGSWSQPFVVLPAFASQTRRYVVEIDDPAAADGLARANAMVLSYGF